MLDLPIRIRNKISPEPNSGCWIWIGAAGKHEYGHIRWENKYWRAHRLLYTLIKGCIPVNLEIDHLCRNKCCVNPDHLEAVTHKINMERSIPTRYNTYKTHCINGHEYSKENTLIINRTKAKGWYRRCRECHNSNRRKNYNANA